MENTDILENLKSRMYLKVFRLALLNVGLYVPNYHYNALNYLCEESDEKDKIDFELVMLDLDELADIDFNDFVKLSDQTFRAKRFFKGFYLNHQFGEKAIKITRGNTHYIIGRNLEKIMWIYYVKYFLTHFAVNNEFLHLKAAAVVDEKNRTTLIIGKQSGGKTVLQNTLIKRGYRFLSNTHVLVQANKVYGVNSSIRVRNDEIFSKYIRSNIVKNHFEAGDYLVKPARLYKNVIKQSYLANVLITNYGSPEKGVKTVDSEFASQLVQSFSWAISAWSMKEDYLEIVNDSLTAYYQILSREAEFIRGFCAESNNIYSNIDVADEDGLDKLLLLLKS